MADEYRRRLRFQSQKVTARLLGEWTSHRARGTELRHESGGPLEVRSRRSVAGLRRRRRGGTSPRLSGCRPKRLHPLCTLTRAGPDGRATGSKGPGACKGRRVLVRFPPFCAWANRGNQRPAARVLASFWQPFALQLSAATAECLAATPGCPRTLPLDIRLHARRGIGQTRDRSLQPLHTACCT